VQDDDDDIYLTDTNFGIYQSSTTDFNAAQVFPLPALLALVLRMLRFQAQPEGCGTAMPISSL
jgi:hypothetical protein